MPSNASEASRRVHWIDQQRSGSRAIVPLNDSGTPTIVPSQTHEAEVAGRKWAQAMSDLLDTARQWFSRLVTSDEKGQALVEYALIFVLIIIACVAVMTSLGDVVVNNLWALINSMPFGV